MVRSEIQYVQKYRKDLKFKHVKTGKDLCKKKKLDRYGRITDK